MLESEAKVEVDHGTDDDDGAVDGDDERWEDKEVAIPRYSNNEMDDEDAATAKCHACNLQDELTRPRIIMPGDIQ